MPIYHRSGKGKPASGLLHNGELGLATAKIPEYRVDRITDSRLLHGLFRDYTFWASAYLLEPCDILYKEHGHDYGFGRDRLPRNIAVPLVQLAEKIGAKPFMEYALSYVLYNWRRKDPKGPITYDNLALIRSFSELPSESGFILVHVAMVAKTPQLIAACFSVLDAAKTKNRAKFNEALTRFCGIMSIINGEMETMWGRSSHDDYQLFRTFIMGTKSQPMFPHGVIYEGVSAEPLFFRGESGANDSIIPTADNLFGLYGRMPRNPLTAILKDFRGYRPIGHQLFLQHVEKRARQLHVREFALADNESALRYLENLDQVRDFRWRHWNFTKEYILKHSQHPVATGGSPIVTWLPNQLGAVLTCMLEVAERIDPTKLKGEMKASYEGILEKVNAQQRLLSKEVEQLRKQYPGQDF